MRLSAFVNLPGTGTKDAAEWFHDDVVTGVSLEFRLECPLEFPECLHRHAGASTTRRAPAITTPCFDLGNVRDQSSPQMSPDADLVRIGAGDRTAPGLRAKFFLYLSGLFLYQTGFGPVSER